MKKCLFFVLVIVFTMTIITPVSFAQEPINVDTSNIYGYNDLDKAGNEELKETILSNTEVYFNEYYKCLEKLSVSKKISEYSDDNNNMYFYLKILEADIYSVKASGSEIKNPSIDFIEIINSKILDNGDVNADIYVMVRYKYADPTAKMLSATGDLYHMQFSKTSDYKISAISSDSPEYQDKLAGVSIDINGQDFKSDLVKKAIDIAFDDYYTKVDEKKKLLDEIKNAKGEEAVELDTKNEISLLAVPTVNVSYNAARAARYAYLKGGYADTLIFKRMTPDCTNFVSQCLWVGYGGDEGCPESSWFSDEGVTALRSLAYANYRQIGGSTGWWGASQGGSSTYASQAWRSVESLWPYLSTTSNGPRANKYYNMEYFDEDTDMVVVPGDILQFGQMEGGILRYKHSVMVVTGNTALTNTGSIYVAQHSYEYSYRKLSALLVANPSYEYIRVIRPIQGKFNS